MPPASQPRCRSSLRVGDWRALVLLDAAMRVIVVTRVLPRGRAYCNCTQPVALRALTPPAATRRAVPAIEGLRSRWGLAIWVPKHSAAERDVGAPRPALSTDELGVDAPRTTVAVCGWLVHAGSAHGSFGA